ARPSPGAPGGAASRSFFHPGSAPVSPTVGKGEPRQPRQLAAASGNLPLRKALILPCGKLPRSRGTLPSCRTPPAGHNCARASLRRPTTPMARFLFPRWANKVVPMGLLFGVLPLGAAVIGGFWYYGTNKHVEVG